MEMHYVAIDVGTHSARAALINSDGRIFKKAEKQISIYKPETNFYEQSGEEIWECCCFLVKEVTENISKKTIKGVGFDATCSLVVLDENFQPLPVNDKLSKDSEHCYNIIMWMDHRAFKQAELINETKHEVLRNVGGEMSLEMQPPKLMWLKENLPEVWRKAAHFFDLPDFLTFKATGKLSRSLCSLACKWTYSSQNGWSESFWKLIGLDDLGLNNFSKIGNKVLPPGSSIEGGLSQESASELNLFPHTAVATSVIDAHCGCIGTIGVDVSGVGLECEAKPISQRISLICGTSSCHMAISKEPLFVPGVWGPYYSVIVPELWVNEGGQSATGKLIDYIVETHPAYKELQNVAEGRRENVYQCLNEILRDISKESESEVDLITRHLHMWPDFHGNRSPIADPTLCGSICGLTLDVSIQDLAKLYLATVQSLAFGSRHIIDQMKENGHNISTVFMCGGLSKNQLFLQVHANILDKPIVLGQEDESVLIGGAVIAALAAKSYPTMQEAMEKLCQPGKVVYPQKKFKIFYDKKYKVYLSMLKHQEEYKTTMSTEH